MGVVREVLGLVDLKLPSELGPALRQRSWTLPTTVLQHLVGGVREVLGLVVLKLPSAHSGMRSTTLFPTNLPSTG